MKFKSILRRPAKPRSEDAWAFLVLPKDVSETLPRRGRTSVQGTLNGQPLLETLEPDGQLGHWLRLTKEQCAAAGAAPGDMVTLDIRPVAQEPEPAVPRDFQDALAAAPDASRTWADTSTVARVDWIHWITSAKQPRTRAKRIADACAMLAEGKRRVCCFDPSGYYSKAFGAPEAAD